MSSKVPHKSLFHYYDEGDAYEERNRRNVPPGHVPRSNADGLRAKDRNTTQGLVAKDGIGIKYSGTSGGRHVVSSSRNQDTRPGAEAMVSQGRHHPVFIEEKRKDGIGIKYSGTSGGRHAGSSSRKQDTSPGAEAMVSQGRHHPVFIEEKCKDGIGIKYSGTSGGRRLVSSSRNQDTRSGAEEPMVSQGRYDPVFLEEKRPGAFVVPGIDNLEGYDDVGLSTSEEMYEEQATTATRGIIARVVDTEEEYRMRREQDRMRRELDRAVHERDQLRKMMAQAVVVNPVSVADIDEESAVAELDEESAVAELDEESGNDKVVQGAAKNGGGLPKPEDQKFCTRGRRWFAIGAVLLIVVAGIAVALAIVIPQMLIAPESSTPAPTPATTLFRVNWSSTHLGSCTTLVPKVTMTCMDGAAIDLMQESDQTNCTNTSASEIVCVGTYSYLSLSYVYSAEFTCIGANLAASALLGGGEECTADKDASWARHIQLVLHCNGEPKVVGTCYPKESLDNNTCTLGQDCEKGNCSASYMTIPDITSIIDVADCGTLR